ncbi:hypothetical protein LINPERHAP2_LOCUS15968 [Linum perenne]
MQEDVEANPRCPRVVFSDDEIKSFYRPWSKALVVRVLEKTFSYGAVKRRLEALWANNGGIQVSDISNAFFLVRFADPEDYQRAAFGGPWKIFDYYISVARWTPEFNEEEPLKTILTWVRLPKLPVRFFNTVAVTRIGNYICKTVRLDLATAEGARARYARVCVEVDISKPLLGKYMIDNRTFLVEYESLEKICATCGFYGHKADGCPLNQPVASEKLTDVHANDPKITGDAGEWMVVQRKGRGKGRKVDHEAPKKSQSSSGFNVLQVEEVETRPQSSIETDIEAPRSEKVDKVTADLAAKLAEVLQQAPHMQEKEVLPIDDDATGQIPRLPLADVTNGVRGNGGPNKSYQPSAGAGKQSAKGSKGLVDVPVIYDNPTFRGVAQSSTSKPRKQVQKHDQGLVGKDRQSRPVKGVRKDGSQVHSFVTRKVLPDEALQSIVAPKAGEPPDRS